MGTKSEVQTYLLLDFGRYFMKGVLPAVTSLSSLKKKKMLISEEDELSL